MQEAQAFRHGAHVVSDKHRVYIWPTQYQDAEQYETEEQIKRAKRAISMGQSRKKGTKSE
jgi:hypothetical protein